MNKKKKMNTGSELYRPSDRRTSAKRGKTDSDEEIERDKTRREGKRRKNKALKMGDMRKGTTEINSDLLCMSDGQSFWFNIAQSTASFTYSRSVNVTIDPVLN
jgi:hypothetical protein